MQKSMHVGSDTKAHSLAHWEGLPAICTRAFGMGAVDGNRDLWAQLEGRTVSTQVTILFLHGCNGPHIPMVGFILQFFKAHGQRSDRSAVIHRMAGEYIASQFQGFVCE